MFHKAPIDCMDDQDLTPLFYASKAGIAINVFELCEKGSNVNHTINVDPSPVTTNEEQLPKVNGRIRITCTDEDDQPPEVDDKIEIHSTIEEESPEDVNDNKVINMDYLLDHQKKITDNPEANEKCKQSSEVTALYFAKNLDVVDVLLEKGVKPSNKSMIQLMNRNSDLAKAVLDNCLSIKKDGKKEDKEILQMDFSIFEDEENDMSLFEETKDHIQEELLLHPMIKMFLHMKFFSMYKFKLYYAMALYCFLVGSFVGLGYTYVQVEQCSNLNGTCFETKIANIVVCPEDRDVSTNLPKLNCHKYGFIEGISGNEEDIEAEIGKLRGTTSLEQGFFLLSVVKRS